MIKELCKSKECLVKDNLKFVKLVYFKQEQVDIAPPSFLSGRVTSQYIRLLSAYKYYEGLNDKHKLCDQTRAWVESTSYVIKIQYLILIMVELIDKDMFTVILFKVHFKPK